MKLQKKTITAISSLLLMAGTSTAEVLTLQNGRDGYEGCEDAVIAHQDDLVLMDIDNPDNIYVVMPMRL